MADQLEFKISESIVKPIIQAKIQTALVEAMGGHEQMIADMMNAYMTQKVDSEGHDGRGYRDDRPRLEWLVHKMLADAMRTALTEYLKTKQDLMAKEFEKFFNSKKGTNQLVKAMHEGLCAALMNDWRTTITFQLPK